MLGEERVHRPGPDQMPDQRHSVHQLPVHPIRSTLHPQFSAIANENASTPTDYAALT